MIILIIIIGIGGWVEIGNVGSYLGIISMLIW
jgi:hypothetical protein